MRVGTHELIPPSGMTWIQGFLDVLANAFLMVPQLIIFGYGPKSRRLCVTMQWGGYYDVGSRVQAAVSQPRSRHIHWPAEALRRKLSLV